MRRLGNTRAGLAGAFRELGNPPRPGRPPNIDAIHRAAVVLMSAQLEAFIEDLHAEATSHLVAGEAGVVDAIVSEAHYIFQNPRADAIERLFRTIGLPGILRGVHWRNASNPSVRRRLKEFIDLRNDVAHGEEVRATKRIVKYYGEFIRLFATNLDEKVRVAVNAITHHSPW